MTLITTTYDPATHKLVPIEPTDEWKYKVMRHYQPNLSITSKAWKDLMDEMLYWHKAITAAPTHPTSTIKENQMEQKDNFAHADMLIKVSNLETAGGAWRAR